MKQNNDPSFIDALTGLYNRSFFVKLLNLKQSKKKIIIIICNIDGLRIINDTVGHNYGDQLIVVTADLLRKNFPENAIISRIDGDEFAIILSNISENSIKKMIQCLQQSVMIFNQNNSSIPLSLSCGYAMSKYYCDDLESINCEAINNMVREKLFHSQSGRSAGIQILTKALEARDYLTEGHGERLQFLVCELAASIGLPERRFNDLRLFAQFHDVGKIGIPDRILLKKGTLTYKEIQEMERHSEIGYRIAQTAPDLAHISDWILKHHEWWNGKGYPFGLQGENIPLECRILSIVDAFDAMTHDRPYR